MPKLLLATDADWIRDEVEAGLAEDGTEIYRVRRGIDVIAVCKELSPELVIVDMQIGNMGGIATTMAVRHEEEMARIEPTAVLVLADRSQDLFLARRADADGVLVKPLDAFRLRMAATALLAGEAYTDGVEQPDEPDEPDEGSDTVDADLAAAAG